MAVRLVATMEKRRPLIFDIKGHALEDGPGIRTTVFFKGCPLRCWWCQNPESIEAGEEIGFYAADCLRCGDCVAACSRGAISLDNPARIDRTRCDRCGDCVEVCPGLGLRRIGTFYPVEELMAILLRDRVFYEESGGGVTLSGGEPTLHLGYLAHLLKALKREGIHAALQTNGFFAWPEFTERVLGYLDLIMFDIKVVNPEEHLRYTGQDNGLILENLARLLKVRPDAVLPRLALIPGLTATARNLQGISRLLQELRVTRCALLPYNPTGFAKAERLGKTVNPRLSRRLMSLEEEQHCREIFSWAEPPVS
jgi:pyruvate formate lyase activating enzyme